MTRSPKVLWGIAALVLGLNSSSQPQEVKLANAKSWELSGRMQLQYLYDTNTDADAARTNNGFFMRRARLQAKGKLTDWVETLVQIDVRDNSPRLKDAIGQLTLFSSFQLRVGQFKVPLWREELRSSAGLLLVERSAAADFLLVRNLSARHVGVEFGRMPKAGLQFAVNVSNGAGEGGREDAGRTKDNAFVNNGKLLTGRINVPVGKKVQIALAGAANRVGAQVGAIDNTGTISAIAPDVGVYLPMGSKGQFDLEGGAAWGKISGDFLGTSSDQSFRLFDVTGRWMAKFNGANSSLAGMDAFELAAGISRVEPNTDVNDDETMYIRFGPAFYFAKQTRIQVNGEIENPSAGNADNVFKIRSQATLNF